MAAHAYNPSTWGGGRSSVRGQFQLQKTLSQNNRSKTKTKLTTTQFLTRMLTLLEREVGGYLFLIILCLYTRELKITHRA